jgi:hypothetical protein
LQLSLDSLQFHLVLLLHGSERIDQFLDNLQCFFDSIAILFVGDDGLPFLLPLPPLLIQILLQLDDLVCELFYFLLVDVWEVVDVGVVELFDRFG